MKSYAQWLESLIEVLNTDTLVEDPWTVEFVDQSGLCQRMSNSRVEMKKKNGIWVFALDKEQGEFPEIRSYLEQSQTILKVNRTARNDYGKANVPPHYEKVFRIDTIIDEQSEMAVLLDREDNIIETMQLKDCLDFVDRFALPVPMLSFRGRFENT